MDFANMKTGGDAMNMAAAGSLSGSANSAGIGAGTGVLGSLGAGFGAAAGLTGAAVTEQGQGAAGGSTADNTSMGGANINT